MGLLAVHQALLNLCGGGRQSILQLPFCPTLILEQAFDFVQAPLTISFQEQALRLVQGRSPSLSLLSSTNFLQRQIFFSIISFTWLNKSNGFMLWLPKI